MKPFLHAEFFFLICKASSPHMLRNSQESERRFCSDGEVYDPTTNTWSRIESVWPYLDSSRRGRIAGDIRAMKHGDGISLTSPVPDAFPGRGQCRDGMGTFPKRFREVGTAKVFGDGEVRFWKRFRNVLV